MVCDPLLFTPPLFTSPPPNFPIPLNKDAFCKYYISHNPKAQKKILASWKYLGFAKMVGPKTQR